MLDDYEISRFQQYLLEACGMECDREQAREVLNDWARLFGALAKIDTRAIKGPL